MSNPRERIAAEITANSAPEHKTVLMIALSCCETAGEFQSLAKVRWVNNERCWWPSPVLVKLVDRLQGVMIE